MDLPSLPDRVNIHTLEQWEGDSIMADWPDWFQENLQQRFYDLTKVAERQVQAILLLENAYRLHMELKNQTDIPVHDIILEWEAAMTLEHSFEKEWLYFEGVIKNNVVFNNQLTITLAS
jgi:hypothetical protein